MIWNVVVPTRTLPTGPAIAVTATASHRAGEGLHGHDPPPSDHRCPDHRRDRFASRQAGDRDRRLQAAGPALWGETDRQRLRGRQGAARGEDAELRRPGSLLALHPPSPL